MKRDILFSKQQIFVGNFVFDERVVEVFDDMIKRSVPGYETVIHMTGTLAHHYAQPHSVCYDLGCSLGAATYVMRRTINDEQVKIIAVDSSPAMLKQCQENLGKQHSHVQYELLCSNIVDVEIKDASVVVLNFTLQFIEPFLRKNLIEKIYRGMLPGSVLLLSEKITFDDPQEQHIQEELHHDFKRINGYSDLEIAQKRTALEKVLIPETFNDHKNRLEQCGFKIINKWFQCFNFMSLIACK